MCVREREREDEGWQVKGSPAAWRRILRTFMIEITRGKLNLVGYNITLCLTVTRYVHYMSE